MSLDQGPRYKTRRVALGCPLGMKPSLDTIASTLRDHKFNPDLPIKTRIVYESDGVFPSLFVCEQTETVALLMARRILGK